ncbi:DoxX family protein [Actinokineospora sp. HUAS TT18]|uniref:DoxX family protein n=1 Tax=Actinokineospora sp. HUAS TT18 TaxID=3447451 RepID=UPI003F524C69
MNVALWIVAGLLAVSGLAGGAMLLFVPKKKLAASGFGWVDDFSAGTVQTIGTLKVMAGIGLTLPALLDIAPVFVPLAATGWAALMVGAGITHLRRNEANFIVVNVIQFAMAAFVVWGRFGPHAF